MGDRNRTVRRTAGNVLLTVGLLMLLGIAAYFGWTQLQAAQVRAALAQNPAPAPVVREAEVTPLATAAPPTLRPTLLPTRLPATSAATAVLPTQPPPAPAAEAAPAAIATPVTAAPTPAPTTVPPTPAPVVTAAPMAAQVGSPVRLAFADLRIDAKVVPMGWEVIQTASGPRSEWVIPEDDAGHHINSALLGQDDNLVISGHNNIYARVFERISLAWDDDARIQVDSYTDRSDVLNGRIITLYDAAGRGYDYAVTDFIRLKDTGVPVAQRVANARFMQPTGEEQLTIITCWPPTNNTHRLIVVAKPVQ